MEVLRNRLDKSRVSSLVRLLTTIRKRNGLLEKDSDGNGLTFTPNNW